jgi:radical SAM protein with 4Fe4S-binding SPASM domain
MIGFTKLLCGGATVSRALRQASGQEQREPGLLQFTTAERPLVVWNTTLRCNLRCLHCYNDAGQACADELTTQEAERLIADLAQMGSPVLLFSGGEPLLREDIYHLGDYAAARGVRPVLSTNGTLITAKVAGALKRAQFQYIGVSIDGLAETHDRLRCRAGASEAAWEGLRQARAAGLRTGVRFTVTRDNVDDLPGVLDQSVGERVNRFCMYHLVYCGRGAGLADRDLSAAERRRVIQWLVERTEELHRQRREIEILTTDNHADGVYLYRLIMERDPSRGVEVLALLAMHGGCSAGRKFANVDSRGDVHACQFWGHESLGNVRERPFSRIWQHPGHPLLGQLKQSQGLLTGRCGDCRYKAYCGGCRIRAQAVHGELWGPDPACYLTDEETGSDARESVEGATASK